MFHVKRSLVQENKTRIVLDFRHSDRFDFADALPRPFVGRGRAAGAGEGQYSGMRCAFIPSPVGKGLKARDLVQRATFPARDSGFRVRAAYPPAF